MANDRERNRGMFGYEGEGFMRGGDAGYRGGGYNGGGYSGGSRIPEPYRGQSGPMSDPCDRGYEPRGYADLESSATDRGWNIGRDIDMGSSPRQSHRGRGPKNYQRSDDRIREEVCERLAMDHDIDASEMEVNVEGGVVTLNGSVNDRQMKRLAEDLCESVRGVNDVQNNVRVTR